MRSPGRGGREGGEVDAAGYDNPVAASVAAGEGVHGRLRHGAVDVDRCHHPRRRPGLEPTLLAPPDGVRDAQFGDHGPASVTAQPRGPDRGDGVVAAERVHGVKPLRREPR